MKALKITLAVLSGLLFIATCLSMKECRSPQPFAAVAMGTIITINMLRRPGYSSHPASFVLAVIAISAMVSSMVWTAGHWVPQILFPLGWLACVIAFAVVHAKEPGGSVTRREGGRTTTSEDPNKW
jgi:hypothetical protein